MVLEAVHGSSKEWPAFERQMQMAQIPFVSSLACPAYPANFGIPLSFADQLKPFPA